MSAFRFYGGEMAMAAMMAEPSPFWAYFNPEKAKAEREKLRAKTLGSCPRCREVPRPPEPEDFFDAFAEALKNTYGAKLWWSCNGYQKLEDMHGRVWISPPSRVIEVGNGNRARRRLGQTFEMEPDPDACPCRRTDCECSETCCPSEKGVWRNADGTIAEEW